MSLHQTSKVFALVFFGVAPIQFSNTISRHDGFSDETSRNFKNTLGRRSS